MIRFWREIAIAILVVSTAAFFGLWRYEALDHKTTKESLKTAQATIKQHLENIEIVERANNEYQSNIDRLNADVKRLRKRPAKCITITPELHSETGSGRGHGEENGISSGWLYDYAIEAEELRIERNACKDFVNDVWESQK